MERPGAENKALDLTDEAYKGTWVSLRFLWFYCIEHMCKVNCSTLYFI